MMANAASLHVQIYGIIICVGICSASCTFPKIRCEQLGTTYAWCETTIPAFEKQNCITDLDYRKCKPGLLSNKTLKNLDNLDTLTIKCDFSADVPLELEVGIFEPVKSKLRTLELNSNNIRSLPDRTFCALVNVTYIYLSNNALTEVKDVGFGLNCGEDVSSRKLGLLDIHRNAIKTLHNSTFRHLSQLWTLKASDNGLEQIELGAFAGMVALSTLNLSSNRLTSFPPQVFQNLTELGDLYLAGNSLTYDSLANVTYPGGLRTLDLSNNRITVIDNTMFQNLSNLSFLYLSSNQLRIISSAFASMPALETLHLNNASIEEIKSEAFRDLFQLEMLDLSDNKLKVLEPGTFAHFSNLPYSKFSGVRNVRTLPDAKVRLLKTLKLARNEIGDLNSFTSFSLPKLEELDLSQNLIEVIKKETFHGASKLHTLDLSHNKIRQIEMGAFDNLVSDWYRGSHLNMDNNELTNIDHLFHSTNLTTLSLNHNKLTNFSYSSIPLKLNRLSLHHNQISDIINKIPYDSFESMELQSLDFSNNQLKGVRHKDFPQWLEHLSLHNNSIQHIYEDLKYSLPKMKNLTLHNNKLEMLCFQTLNNNFKTQMLTTTLSGNPFNCSCEIEWMTHEPSSINSYFGYIKDLQSVKCRSLLPRYGTQFRSITGASKDEKFLCKSTHEYSESCNCSTSNSSQCNFPCPDKCSCYRNGAFDFVIVDCSESDLTILPVITFRQVSTLHLHVDGNNIRSINESSFQSYPNVTRLYLNSSKVETIAANALGTLTALELLQLDNNMLTALPDAIFLGLSNLKELYLGHNHLVQLNDEIFSPLKSVMILDLSNNSLVRFPVWELGKLNFLTEVDLNHNKWGCDCEYIDKFRTWLQAYVNIVADANDLVCSDQSIGQEMPMISFSFKECYQATPLQLLAKWAPAWGSSVGVILLLFVAIILAFIYRREMQVLIYSRYGVRIFSNTAEETDPNKLYDAFIAYSCLDEDFLLNDFLPPLEQIENPFKLCLHHRDFLAGAFITDNILEAVEKSRRTIMLLSENFMKSEWCRFEFKAAHIQMMKDRCNRVIIVVLGEVPKELDPDMKLYLTTNTFLKWGDKLFWEKLYFALPDKNST